MRHAQVPLRLGAAGTDAVVESMPLRCSHFDAYRFFTAAPRPPQRRTADPRRAGRHRAAGLRTRGMDLYKWGYKLGPLVDSDLVLDCLELAADARELDMRASPYDLSDLRIRTDRRRDAAGRAEYVRAQQDVAERAAPLRAALADRARSCWSRSSEPADESSPLPALACGQTWDAGSGPVPLPGASTAS